MFIPLRIGGGPDEVDVAYRVLRASQGIGGSAPDDSGIDGLWRRARAFGLASGESANVRAFNNFFPFCATDTIPYYERHLGLVASPGATLADRRDEVMRLWPAKASARRADIESELQRIDSRFVVLSVSDHFKSTSMPGRCLAPNAGSGEPTYGARHCSPLARPSSRSTFRIRLATGTSSVLTARDRAVMRTAKIRLRRILPSWCDYTVTTTSTFTLNHSLLGTTGL
jgi:hypothetical protein